MVLITSTTDKYLQVLSFWFKKAAKFSMASSSFVSLDPPWVYDVFLSFTGVDTRKTFTDHLYNTLKQKGINTFRDAERLERGSEIAPEILGAIERSKISIIVLSKNYAYSSWCLEEVAKIIDCMTLKRQTVYPIFYDVDPSDVRKQEGEFKKAFDKHVKENIAKVRRWRSAITRVADVAGWHPQDYSYESEMIKEIVDKIWRKLNLEASIIAKDLVGLESRVDKINVYIEPKLEDIRFIGIWGMGGIGKTTIARAVYDNLKEEYEGCSFVSNVREESQKNGLVHLQRKLLSDVLNGINLNVGDVYDGINLIRRRLCQKRVLLVLDDVNQPEQLEALAGNTYWFGPGSRILITTRDNRLLRSHGVKKTYKVEGLDYNEASQLFNLKAFKHQRPTHDHLELSKQIINHTKRLPLALKVLGSFLCDGSVNEWKSAWDRLKEVPDNKIVDVLQISFDGLRHERDKKIFLDVACFFKGKEVNQVRKKLDGFDFNSEIGLQELVDKCLITISYDNVLWMHDLVQMMGWKVVRDQHPNDPGKWSRLWLSKDIYRVLKDNMGTHAVECIKLDKPEKEIRVLDGKSFSNMKNLRLLKISNVSFSEDLEYLSNELRFLKWREYPLKSLPSSFHAENIVELNLCGSHLEYLWEGQKSFQRLKTIKLCFSRKLFRTPNFTEVPNLERLDLEGCISLREVDQSVGLLKSLTVLNLKDCKNLESFSSIIHNLTALKILNLYGCSKLDKLPENLGNALLLEELDISRTAVRLVPSSIVALTNLKTFSLHGCKGEAQPVQTWINFFRSICMPKRNSNIFTFLLMPPRTGLSSLKKLDLGDCNLSEGAIPSDIGFLSSLQELNLSRNNFVTLPESIKQLSKLKILFLEKCPRLSSLSQLPPNIVFVGADGCHSLETLPSTLLELCTSQEVALNLMNCFKLAENHVGNNLADIFLKLWLQNFHPNISHRFHIHLPGNEIPRWFTFWTNEGDSIKIETPPHRANKKFLGFAVCAVFAVPEAAYSTNIHVQVKCIIETSNLTIELRFPLHGLRRNKSDHLFLGYMSDESFEGCRKFPGRHVVSKIYVYSRYNIVAQVKKCGIRPVYEQDLDIFVAHHIFEEQPIAEDTNSEQNHDENKLLDYPLHRIRFNGFNEGIIHWDLTALNLVEEFYEALGSRDSDDE